MAEAPRHRHAGVVRLASPQDLCQAFATPVSFASKPGLEQISTIMSANDGGLGVEKKSWPTVWFKSGAEPGGSGPQLECHDCTGTHPFGTILMTANPKNTLNEDTAAPELLALARGAFALAAN